MARADIYIRLPRSMFNNKAWEKATMEQRAALVDLCFRVAYCEHDFIVNNTVVVRVQIGQYVTTQKELEEHWKMSRQQVRSMLTALKCLGYIATKAVTKGFNRYTVLTVNALTDTDNQGISKNPTNKQKESIQKESTNPLENPPLGEFPQKISSVGKGKSLKKKLLQLYDEYEKKWKGYIEDNGVLMADETRTYKPDLFRGYLPKNLNWLGSDSRRAERLMKKNAGTSVLGMCQWQMEEFFVYHLLHFIKTSGIQNGMEFQQIKEMAANLCIQCQDLHPAQVSLFFYYMLTSDANVGSPQFRSGFNRIDVNKALNTFLDKIN